MYLIIKKICNCMGRGYEIRIGYIHHRYYGYSKREAVSMFRREYGLKGKHLTTIEY